MKNQIRNLLLGVLATSSFLVFSPLKTQARTETLVSCTAGRFYIRVEYNTSNDRYIYTAYEGGDRSNPSLVLKNGYKRDTRNGFVYVFDNGDFSYVVSGRGERIRLDVYESGETILSKQCYPDGE